MTNRPETEVFKAKRLLGRWQWRWRVKRSGRKLAGSTEGYNNSADMLAAMRSTRDALNAFLAVADKA